MPIPFVTHGSHDTGDPAVVAVVDAEGVTECTATVIGRHFALTAAHCIGTHTGPGARVVLGTDVSNPIASVPITGARVDPAFDPQSLAHDAAILVLGSSPPVQPVALATSEPPVGAMVTVVGWGESMAQAMDWGTKLSGTAVVTGVDSLFVHAAPDPSQPCAGDSGGPLFPSSGSRVLAGITTHGDTACATDSSYTRVDLVASDFVVPTLAALGEGTVAAGGRCLYPEQCEGGAGACVTAADDARLAYCTESCNVNADCPGFMLCVSIASAGSQCRYAVPTPGAFGGACRADGDCITGTCAGGVCTTRCNPAEANACPGSSSCEASNDGIDYFCTAPSFAAPTGGCSSAPPARRCDAWALVAAGAVVAAGLRRARAATMRR